MTACKHVGQSSAAVPQPPRPSHACAPPPSYGGIGGLSEAMGWTKVQTDNGDPQFLGGVNSVLLGVAAFLALDLLSILVGYIQVRMGGAP